MPKTIKNVFYQNLTYIKLYEAHLRASKNKRKRPDILVFELDLETNLMNLYNQILTNTYTIGKYHNFIIYEPKMRLIQSLPYRDRIVHQWYVEEFIIPYFVPKFINDSYACIKNRGTHKAVEKIEKYMRIMKRNYGSYYILKCDIHKYFYNIRRDILFSILNRNIKDKALLKFTELLIFDGRTDDNNVGIPIGNYTSQYFANIYLNEFDHYVKEKLKVKYYVRYMDDFVILVPTKEEARYLKKEIAYFLESVLKLKLNAKSKYYPNELGLDFCGFKIYETHRLVRNRSKKKIRSIVKKANNDFENGILKFEDVRIRYNSWKAHASHANSYHLTEKYHEMFHVSKYLK